MSERLSRELNKFSDVWTGGYFEGNPLDPLTKSSYGQLGYVSSLYATYIHCIKPYINENTKVLEIGPGRGAWTRTFLDAESIVVMDALSAEHNQFWSYIPKQSNIRYIHVQDFLCEDLPENYFDFMFSFGTLCHVSFEGIEQYAQNLFPKLRSGANCFWMISDYDKYNYAVENIKKFGIIYRLVPKKLENNKIIKYFLSVIYNLPKVKIVKIQKDLNNEPSPGRWYNAQLKRTTDLLENLGYRIINPDVGTNLRDPIIHFTKPKD